jgi:hypothetical protein
VPVCRYSSFCSADKSLAAVLATVMKDITPDDKDAAIRSWLLGKD